MVQYRNSGVTEDASTNELPIADEYPLAHHINTLHVEQHGYIPPNNPTVPTLHRLNAVHIMQPSFIPSSDVHQEPEPEPPPDPQIQSVTINALHPDLDNIPPPPPISFDAADAIRCQLDTGAAITCTNLIEILHDYKAYSDTFPCKIRLIGAIDSNNGVYPLGEGYLHIPADTNIGYARVRCIYSPHLTSTLLSEDDIIRSNPNLRLRDYTTAIYKHNAAGTFTLACVNHTRREKTFAIHGIISSGKCYTQPLMMPDLPPQHPRATQYNSFQKALQCDKQFAADCHRAVVHEVQLYQERAHAHIEAAIDHLPEELKHFPYKEWTDDVIPILAIKAKTERLLWHQRLGHPSDSYLYTAHKYIDGVPKFKHFDPILESCPTCIRAKQHKEPSGPNTTRTATRPFQGLSVDFSFSGTRSKDESRRADYEGINGETSWILISDHFTRHLIGDTRLSKASPINYLRRFLDTYAPKCNDKYVFLDQGGELYGNPEVRALFTKYGYKIRPTGADNSSQNGPVERSHRTLADKVRCLLTGANLPIRFWPYAFAYAIRIENALPGKGQTKSPIELALGVKENLKRFRTFGCRVWVRPPGRRPAKLRANSRKGVFLGFTQDTTRNIIWYDVESQRIKIATHARFDEGMNDLPLTSLPPNVVHLNRTDSNAPIQADSDETAASDFCFHISPFDRILTKDVRVQCNSPTFGMALETDLLNGRAYVREITRKSSASKLFSSHRATRNKIRGAFITSINGTPVFTKDEVINEFRKLRQGKTKSFEINFAIMPKPSADRLRREITEHDMFTPDTIDNNDSSSIDYVAIRAITARLHNVVTTDDVLPHDLLELAINALQSNSITPEEQALGHFTRRKLRTLETWPLWLAGERKQLNQFHDLKMYGIPIPRPPNAIVLRPHWQYNVKRDGERRSRQCCDGSNRAAPLLHALAKTYSSCVEHPIQRLFLALAAALNYQCYAGDATDAYAHSPRPAVPTYLAIDDAYAEWYKWKFGEDIDRSLVLPVNHALQGHPESGRLWEEHINSILESPELGFSSTVHDKCIYQTIYNGEKVLLLRQVDDFLIATSNENIAKEIYDIIGKKLQLPGEDKPPFKYLGLAHDYNGVDIIQTKQYIELACPNYIDRVAKAHNVENPTKDEILSKPTSPISSKCLDHLYDHTGPAEGTTEYSKLRAHHGFSYRSLLGELLYAYVTCRPDIGFAITTLSKFSQHPADIHYLYLLDVLKYLRRTRTWGLRYRKPTASTDPSLPDGDFSNPPDPLPACLPTFPALPTDTTFTCFVDAAYGNVKPRKKSTTGFAILMSGAAILYRSKTQTQTALSSTEAEFYAAVSAAKIVRYLRSITHELGFQQKGPTQIYEDNDSTTKIVGAKTPTERSRHIAIPYFAIQDWKREGDITLTYVPGTINPADALTKPLAWILHNRHARRLMGHHMPDVLSSSLIQNEISDQGRVLTERQTDDGQTDTSKDP